jgi:hypothetical protein
MNDTSAPLPASDICRLVGADPSRAHVIEETAVFPWSDPHSDHLPVIAKPLGFSMVTYNVACPAWARYFRMDVDPVTHQDGSQWLFSKPFADTVDPPSLDSQAHRILALLRQHGLMCIQEASSKLIESLRRMNTPESAVYVHDMQIDIHNKSESGADCCLVTMWDPDMFEWLGSTLVDMREGIVAGNSVTVFRMRRIHAVTYFDLANVHVEFGQGAPFVKWLLDYTDKHGELLVAGDLNVSCLPQTIGRTTATHIMSVYSSDRIRFYPSPDGTVPVSGVTAWRNVKSCSLMLDRPDHVMMVTP